jgi:serine/threonine-protein kinase RsbW/stage II sporulation protein AB (anti-sigma F factor)
VSDEAQRGELAVGELGGDIDDPGLLIYERVLPAIPGSVGRIRNELVDSLKWHELAADRRADIALVVTEAATNAVVHAYLDASPGPLYVAATLGGACLTVWIADFGRGMLPRCGSPGLGLGMSLIGRLCDELHVDSDGDEPGTCVTATFAGIKRAAERSEGRRQSPATGSSRREILVDYLQALRTTNQALRHDTAAVLAQADLAVARARRQRHQRVLRR